ncbi:MAG: ABC transporter ATP-binding protein [Candidatus Eisenbacteria bacterium]|uniref:ABC transporter ATP-binding protein n=1 Tax=Eiseniibacteriota bacterium TaxID=2212470 RepID=A0A948W4Z6_UNCEI|nr:ABC transporter ATP-binding protein [Candidatus Eisenbacteria bacterium]MBU1948285.1 ABC transporter ATP-binding protein [Candidatus Eisenbacteria bacterium]MBU2689859.1 ABC transporter ATP-binding protein [Candidatus Eisenbacteria bacterium]
MIEASAIIKIYRAGSTSVAALQGVDLCVGDGEFIAIMGTSGSGKSTLMNILGCLDRPTKGEYRLDGIPVHKMKPDEMAAVRNEKIGFVFQGFNLLSRTSAQENVELPLLYDRTHRMKNPREAAADALAQVGLGDRKHHDPNQLSGGEQQRVAVARAIVSRPAILMADEPTGNLDSKTTVEILDLFKELNNQGMTILMVTHEWDVAQRARRIIEMCDGRIVSDKSRSHEKALPSHLCLSIKEPDRGGWICES